MPERGGVLMAVITALLMKQPDMGTAMVMGRRTFDSLPGILPGRRFRMNGPRNVLGEIRKREALPRHEPVQAADAIGLEALPPVAAHAAQEALLGDVARQ